MELRAAPRARPAPWRSLPCPRAELRLELVLASGQSFRWRESSPGCWTGVLAGRVWTLTQAGERLWYTVYGDEEEEEEEEAEDGHPAAPAPKRRRRQRSPPASGRSPEHPGAEDGAAEPPGPPGAETDGILRDYFQLDVGLPALYRAWGAADPHFQRVAADFPGVRVLRQDPVECLLSFICTSNNHISRITAMIERLCRAFGRRLCCLDSQPFHAFPAPEALAGPEAEARLRALGFGYRAKFVSQSARAIAEELGAEGLRRLRAVPYAEARKVLRSLPGVGAKATSSVGCGARTPAGRRRGREPASGGGRPEGGPS
ncbi:N-glycosylase/DNA lyase isoform X3 [Rhea pennata]|uniref:N-glycosylase/DNA lyase isoform X3 n=1 Tax=Rhea pennata TaxID=8795 RepID=UPI002E258D56